MRETDAASVSGGGSSGGGMEGDVLVGEGVASVSPAVGFQLAGSVCDDKVGEETAWLNGSDTSNSSNGLNREGGGDLAGGDLAGGEATGRGGVGQGGLPPRLPGRSSSSYTELDTMMEHIIPNLGHFPRSDASVAFALNELDTLLSDEVRVFFGDWGDTPVWCGLAVAGRLRYRVGDSRDVLRMIGVGGGCRDDERGS